MTTFGIVLALGKEHLIGKRSLTLNWFAHAMTHFFGDPSLTMGILVGAQFLLHLR